MMSRRLSKTDNLPGHSVERSDLQQSLPMSFKSVGT